MGVGITEFLEVLDTAIASADGRRVRWRRVRTRTLVLPLTVASLWGEVGEPLRHDPEVGARWGYTLAQCRTFREVILAAAREDAQATGLDPTG